jgi:hypothetical protein
MSFVDKRKTSFSNGRDSRLVSGQPITTITGHYDVNNINILSLPLGSLFMNTNLEYKSSGNSIYLQTRRGTTLIKDITFKALGFSQFATTTLNLFVWIDNQGDLKYLDAGDTIQTIQGSMNIAAEYEALMYAHPDTPALYFCQENTGIFKVDDSYAYSLVDSTGVKSIAFSNISRRMFSCVDHKIGYSNAQAATAADLTNLETWDWGAAGQWLLVRPDEGIGFLRAIDTGELTFFFKDTGIWALLNAEEDIANWLVPKCNADQGTLAPKTVKYARYGQAEGIIYLATDKTLRYFNASVQRNSGAKPTLIGGDSRIISENFSAYLEDIPNGLISKCSATYFGRYYILNIVSANGSDVDTTIIIDTEKLITRLSGEEIAQPFWFISLNNDYTHYVLQKHKSLYGVNKAGYINQLLTNNQYYDETPTRITTYDDDTMIDANGDVTTDVGQAVKKQVAIQYKAYLAWYEYSQLESLFYDGYINWQVEGNWGVNFVVNSFVHGDEIPQYDDGISVALSPQSIGGSFFDRSFFDLAYFSAGQGQLSQNVGLQARGNYFLFGLYNNNIYEWSKFFGIKPRFKQVKNIPIGKNY